MKSSFTKQTRRLSHLALRGSRTCALVLAAMFTAYCTVAQDTTLTVRNIAELQAINTTNLSATNTTLVQGYWSAGDRGGGAFHWQAGGTDTPDGGRFLASSNAFSPSGRWQRVFNGETPNVKMWGAQGNISGNGFTTTNVAAAADDWLPIQRALTNSGSAELLFPGGFYKVTNTLVANLPLLKIRGESARMTYLVMPLGIQKDILRTASADSAIAANNGTAGYDENLRIEDITFYFATGSGNYSAQSTHNTNNAGLVICNPEEGTAIRNIGTAGGAYGVRCFGGGAGAPAAFRDVVCTDASIAGISVEPIPGATYAGGQVSITGITGDHRFDESRSNACLVKFINFVGVAVIEDLNAEAAYGGGVIQHKFPDPSAGWGAGDAMGLLSIRSCTAMLGSSFSGLPSGSDFLVMKGGYRTGSANMQNINLSGGNLIRDELTGRIVPCYDAIATGLDQGCCRLPTSYEGYGVGYTNSRLVVAEKAICTFTPSQTGWYRVMDAFGIYGQWRLGGKLEVTSQLDSSEFNVDVLAAIGGSDLAAINVVRSVKDNGNFPPSVTKARAGVYIDAQSNGYAFVDIFVERLIQNPTITLAYPIFDGHNLVLTGGQVPLRPPTTPLVNGNPAPAGFTLSQCVTNSLIR